MWTAGAAAIICSGHGPADILQVGVLHKEYLIGHKICNKGICFMHRMHKNQGFFYIAQGLHSIGGMLYFLYKEERAIVHIKYRGQPKGVERKEEDKNDNG